MIGNFLNKLILCGLVSPILFGLSPISAEVLAQVEIDIKNSNGDRTGASNVVFQVYHYTKDILPYTELKPKSNYPFFVTYLPVDHKYKLYGFVNGIFAGSSIIDIKNNYEQIDFVLPKSGGMNLQIVYNDKQTPIIGATVNIKNQDGKILRKDFSDKDGYTLSFSSLPTIREDDFYQVEVLLAENITHTYSPVKLQPGFTKDIKIITPWPTVVDSLITVYAYDNSLQPIISDNGEYIVELYDTTNNKIVHSQFNNRGEAYFSNLHVNNYYLLVNYIEKNKTTTVLNKTITILGDTKELDAIFEPLLISNHVEDNLKQEIITESTSEIVSCNCVAFRLDDIQDYWLSDVQIEIMDTFAKKNLPLTIGIIGNEIGEDIEIVSYINQTIPKNRLEIANHGWDHEDFTEFDKETQSLLLKKTNKKLHQVFGVVPSVFIPPYNEFDNNTISAMRENYITHFSSSVTLSEPPFPLTNSQLYNFPEAAYTGELAPSSTLFVAVEHKLTLSQIQKSISDYGFAVVMMHPQDFSIMENGGHSNKINWNQIRELELLLDRIQFQGLNVVPISKINLDHENMEKIPHWVRQFSIWWSEGKISDEEYANGLKFYRENGIISV